MRKTLKEMQSHLNTLKQKEKMTKRILGDSQKELEEIRRHIVSAQVKINNFSNEEDIEVSEHTVIRYLERVVGLDIKELKSKILTDSVIDKIKFINGNGEIRTEDGYSLVLKNYTIITLKS